MSGVRLVDAREETVDDHALRGRPETQVRDAGRRAQVPPSGETRGRLEGAHHARPDREDATASRLRLVHGMRGRVSDLEPLG